MTVIETIDTTIATTITTETALAKATTVKTTSTASPSNQKRRTTSNPNCKKSVQPKSFIKVKTRTRISITRTPTGITDGIRAKMIKMTATMIGDIKMR